MKKIFLLVLALISLSGCATMQSVGEAIGDDSLVKASATMTPRQEYYLGRSMAAQIISQQPLSKKEDLNQYVNRIGQYLAVHSLRPETFKGYQFAVVDNSTPTAMSAPGGFVFVSTALIQQAKSEDELAAVLAHEIAHIGLFHAQKTIKQGNTMKTISKYGGMVASLFTNDVVDADMGEMFGGIVNNLLELKFGKSQEIDADREALKTLYNAGYDPSALVRFIEGMSNKAGFFSRHPRNKSRIRKLQKELEQYTWQGIKDKRALRFVEIQKKI